MSNCRLIKLSVKLELPIDFCFILLYNEPVHKAFHHRLSPMMPNTKIFFPCCLQLKLHTRAQIIPVVPPCEAFR